MQKRFMAVLAIGFVFGLGFASCATSSPGFRGTASGEPPRYVDSRDAKEEKPACRVGEERNAAGDCERPFTFDRPFKRGGR